MACSRYDKNNKYGKDKWIKIQINDTLGIIDVNLKVKQKWWQNISYVDNFLFHFKSFIQNIFAVEKVLIYNQSRNS